MPASTIRFGGTKLPLDAEVVDLANARLGGLEPLSRFRGLRELRLAHTNPHASPVGLPLDLGPLASLDRLEVVVLPEYGVRDAGPLRGGRDSGCHRGSAPGTGTGSAASPARDSQLN